MRGHLTEFIDAKFTLAKHVVLEGRNETIPFTITLRGTYSASPPMAFLLVIDTSLSMDGAKIFRAKQAALEILDLLREKDYVAVYGFASRFYKALELTPMSERKKIEESIVSLKLSSGTNIYDTLKKLGEEVDRIIKLHEIPIRIIFLTDGKPETGKKDPNKILEIASQLGKRGVSALVIGVGKDYNEELLLGIAKSLKGVFVHVDNPEELEKVMNEYVKVAKEVSARDVKVYLRLKPGFDVLVYNRNFEKRSDTVTIDVGDINYGETVVVAGDLEIPALTRGVAEVGELHVSYINPLTNDTEYLSPTPIRLEARSLEELREIKIEETVLAKAQIVKSATELEHYIKRGSEEKVAERLSDLIEMTIKIGDEDLATRTINLRERLEREGLTSDLSKELASIISRIMSGKIKEREKRGK